LLLHPEVEVTVLTSQKYAGVPIDQVFPSLARRFQLRCEELVPERVAEKVDFLFAAVPHKTAMETIPQFHQRGKRVVDLSADFRFRDPEVYERWYQKHTSPELLRESVYGLPERYRDRIRKAEIVGNPGCYPTGALLPLLPLLRHGLLYPERIFIDSKSGVSGAGRDVVLGSLFCEVNEGVKAYKIYEHRHLPEINQELSLQAGENVEATFVPHLIPMDRGILTTTYIQLSRKRNTEEILNLYQEEYGKEPFIRILPKGKLPNTKDTRGSNFIDIGLKVHESGERAVIVSAIDNLVKGAAGQAVQNMNIMLGFPETLGLEVVPLFP
jgi:N-acetyl-gamma-glutamyl-phosphate reductase